jgi:hypothetical protein
VHKPAANKFSGPTPNLGGYLSQQETESATLGPMPMALVSSMVSGIGWVASRLVVGLSAASFMLFLEGQMELHSS